MSHQFHSTALREYDIRGIIGETLGTADAYAIGRGFATLLRQAGGSKVAVGYDGRLSSPELEEALERMELATELAIELDEEVVIELATELATEDTEEVAHWPLFAHTPSAEELVSGSWPWVHHLAWYLTPLRDTSLPPV